MNFKLLFAVAFLFAMQLVPFFAFSHYKPTQSVIKMHQHAEPITEQNFLPLLNNNDAVKKDSKVNSDIERF